MNYASKTPVAWLATKDAETKTGGDTALKFPHKLAVTPWILAAPALTYLTFYRK